MAVLSDASLSGQALKAGANKRRSLISSQFHCLCPPWLVYAPDQNRHATHAQAQRKRDSHTLRVGGAYFFEFFLGIEITIALNWLPVLVRSVVGGQIQPESGPARPSYSRVIPPPPGKKNKILVD